VHLPFRDLFRKPAKLIIQAHRYHLVVVEVMPPTVMLRASPPRREAKEDACTHASADDM
jgi:hypothetical protein